MSDFIAFLKLTRIVNIGILMLVESLLYFGYFVFYARKYDVPTALSPLEIVFFIVITALVAIGGNIINDIKDEDIDEINRAETRIVNRIIPARNAWRLYHIVNVFAGLLLAYWTYRTQLYFISSIIVVSMLLLYFYSSWMKRKPLIGNLLIAILCALPPVLILLIESITINEIGYESALVGTWIASIFGAYSFFAFSTSLYREIVKDIEDIPGDKAVGSTTMPILIGGYMAKLFAMLIGVLILISLMGWLFFQWSMYSWISTIAILIGLILPLLISLFRLYRAKTVGDFRLASKSIKILMVNGIVYLLVVRTLIPFDL